MVGTRRSNAHDPALTGPTSSAPDAASGVKTKKQLLQLKKLHIDGHSTLSGGRPPDRGESYTATNGARYEYDDNTKQEWVRKPVNPESAAPPNALKRRRESADGEWEDTPDATNKCIPTPNNKRPKTDVRSPKQSPNIRQSLRSAPMPEPSAGKPSGRYPTRTPVRPSSGTIQPGNKKRAREVVDDTEEEEQESRHQDAQKRKPRKLLKTHDHDRPDRPKSRALDTPRDDAHARRDHAPLPRQPVPRRTTQTDSGPARLHTLAAHQYDGSEHSASDFQSGGDSRTRRQEASRGVSGRAQRAENRAVQSSSRAQPHRQSAMPRSAMPAEPEDMCQLRLAKARAKKNGFQVDALQESAMQREIEEVVEDFSVLPKLLEIAKLNTEIPMLLAAYRDAKAWGEAIIRDRVDKRAAAAAAAAAAAHPESPSGPRPQSAGKLPSFPILNSSDSNTTLASRDEGNNTGNPQTSKPARNPLISAAFNLPTPKATKPTVPRRDSGTGNDAAADAQPKDHRNPLPSPGISRGPSPRINCASITVNALMTPPLSSDPVLLRQEDLKTQRQRQLEKDILKPSFRPSSSSSVNQRTFQDNITSDDRAEHALLQVYRQKCKPEETEREHRKRVRAELNITMSWPREQDALKLQQHKLQQQQKAAAGAQEEEENDGETSKATTTATTTAKSAAEETASDHSADVDMEDQ